MNDDNSNRRPEVKEKEQDEEKKRENDVNKREWWIFKKRENEVKKWQMAKKMEFLKGDKILKNKIEEKIELKNGGKQQGQVGQYEWRVDRRRNALQTNQQTDGHCQL